MRAYLDIMCTLWNQTSIELGFSLSPLLVDMRILTSPQGKHREVLTFSLFFPSPVVPMKCLQVKSLSLSSVWVMEMSPDKEGGFAVSGWG